MIILYKYTRIHTSATTNSETATRRGESEDPCFSFFAGEPVRKPTRRLDQLELRVCSICSDSNYLTPSTPVENPNRETQVLRLTSPTTASKPGGGHILSGRNPSFVRYARPTTAVAANMHLHFLPSLICTGDGAGGRRVPGITGWRWSLVLG